MTDSVDTGTLPENRMDRLLEKAFGHSWRVEEYWIDEAKGYRGTSRICRRCGLKEYRKRESSKLAGNPKAELWGIAYGVKRDEETFELVFDGDLAAKEKAADQLLLTSGESKETN